MTLTGYFCLLLLLGMGALFSLLCYRRTRLATLLGMTFAILGSAAGIFTSTLLIISGEILVLKLPFFFPFFELSLRIDTLSAFFILLISLVALPISIYSLGYMKEYDHQEEISGHPKYNLGVFGFLYNLFLISMILVVSANHALLFLLAWELMAVVSYFLVLYEGKENSQCLPAGFFYIVMTHLGTAFIIAAFFLLFQSTGSLEFDAFRGQGQLLPDVLKSLVFLAAFTGFGAKAGIVPLHGWLPEAHPVAPSNISALMSAVMLKTAIYGMLRFFFDFLGQGPWWWGGTVLLIGGVTALVGVLYALMEKDIKRLLAYSSIENIGIILLGLGLALLFFSYHLTALALLALVALLYHALNHAIFKSLLFAGAGAILYSTHTRNMDELGGLIKVMPLVSGLFLIGTLSIAAMPPFNGFVSEWLLFQSLLQGAAIPSTLSKVVIPLAGATLALTGALAAVVSVKLFGITFLGMPRSNRVSHAKPLPSAIKVGMGLLVFGCITLGLGAYGVIFLLEKSALSLLPEGTTPILTATWITASIAPKFSSLSMPVLLFALTLPILVLYLFLKGKSLGKIEHRGTWDCGFKELKPRMEYTETAYAKPLRIIFQKVFLPTREFEKKYYFPYFPKKMKYTGTIGMASFFNDYLYKPVVTLVMNIADRVRLLHGGSINVYLAYIFATLILILMFQNLKG